MNFGYYGKGHSGYSHYKQDFDRIHTKNQKSYHSSKKFFWNLIVFLIIGYVVIEVIVFFCL